jgi:hypothetical protein
MTLVGGFHCKAHMSIETRRPLALLWLPCARAAVDTLQILVRASTCTLDLDWEADYYSGNGSRHSA